MALPQGAYAAEAPEGTAQVATVRHEAASAPATPEDDTDPNGIRTISEGNPKRGDNWYWDGRTLYLQGIDMKGSGSGALFYYVGSLTVNIQVDGYNRIEGFESICDGTSIDLYGSGTLDVRSMQYLCKHGSIDLSGVYLRADGVGVLSDRDYVTVKGGYVDAPGWSLTDCRGFTMSGGYFNVADIRMKAGGTFEVTGGYLKVSGSIEADNVKYQSCVIRVGTADGDKVKFEFKQDDSVLIIDKYDDDTLLLINTELLINGKTPNTIKQRSDGSVVMCSKYLDDTAGDTSIYIDYKCSGVYYNDTKPFFSTQDMLSGGNYFASGDHVNIARLADAQTTVVGAGGYDNYKGVYADVSNGGTVICEGGILSIDEKNCSSDSLLIGTEGVSLENSTAGRVIAVSGNDRTPALSITGDVTLSEDVTAYHSSDYYGVKLANGSKLTVNGKLCAYSESNNAIGRLTLGESAEIYACAPNAYTHQIIVDSQNGDFCLPAADRFPGKIVYAAKMSEPLKVRSTPEVPDYDAYQQRFDYDKYGYDMIYIGKELYPDMSRDMDYTDKFTFRDLSMEYKNASDSDPAAFDLNLAFSSAVQDPSDIHASLYDPAGNDITDMFSVSMSRNSSGGRDENRCISAHIALRSGKVLDIGQYTVRVEYNGLEFEEKFSVTPLDVILNFCYSSEEIKNQGSVWSYETEYTGYDTICKGDTWSWYGKEADGYEANTLVLNGFNIVTTDNALYVPKGTTIVLKGSNCIQSDMAAITSYYNSDTSLTIVGEKGGKLALTSTELTPDSYRRGVIDLGNSGRLTLKHCDITINAPNGGGVAGINAVEGFSAEDCTIDIECPGIAAVFGRYVLKGDNTIIIKASQAFVYSETEDVLRSVQAASVENVKGIDTDRFNELEMAGYVAAKLEPEDPAEPMVIRTQGIA